MPHHEPFHPEHYDVAAVRRRFPALAEGAAHFDGPGGSQVPAEVGQAVADTLTAAIANRGTVTAAERRADEVVTNARGALADLLGCEPGGVVFGRSMTALTYEFARTLSQAWSSGDEVVVSRLDHDANVRPWVQAAESREATVRWAAPDRATAELPVEAVTDLLSERTRLVAVTGASNLVGTRPDIAAIADAAHRAGALVYVDGVHLTPHAPVDVLALGADFYACSPYKFCGPHHGIVVAAPALLESLHPWKLLPSTNAVPERFELGTLPYELLAGTTAAIDFLASLAPESSTPGARAEKGARRRLVLAAMATVEDWEEQLFSTLVGELSSIPFVQLHGKPARRTPTVLFTVDGLSPREVHEQLGAVGVNAPAGNFYAIEAARWLGLGDEGGVRAGLACYTDENDVARLVEAVRGLRR